MAIQKTETIVLRNQDIRETSLLVTFFTKDFGKIQGIIKGVRGSRGRINNSLEPFAYNTIVFYERKKGNIYTVSQCDLKDYFRNLRKDLKRVAYAYYFSELIKNFLQFYDKNVDIFNLFLTSLVFLDREKIDVEILARIFELQLLSLSGFKPKIDCCLKCSKLVKEKAFFSFNEGGLLCERCASKIKNVVAITHQTLFFIHLLGNKRVKELLHLKINLSIRKELGLILNQFMQVRIEKQLKSLNFIKQIENLTRPIPVKSPILT
jgi:DNA repair protein RecO (recombination protein O)